MVHYRMQRALGAAMAAAVAAQAVPFTLSNVGFAGGGWVTDLHLHHESGFVYARTDVGGAYVSTDASKTWTWLSGYIPATSAWNTQGIASNQSDPSGLTVLVAVGSDALTPAAGVWKSTDGGKTWAQATGMHNVTFSGNDDVRLGGEVLYVEPASPWRVWAAPKEGLYLSVDGGTSFAPVTAFNNAPWFNGTLSNSSYALSLVSPVPNPVDPALEGNVFVGGLGFGLAFTPDGGQTWQQVLTNGTGGWSIREVYRAQRMPNGTTYLAVNMYAPSRQCSRIYRITAPSPAAWGELSQWTWTDVTPTGAYSCTNFYGQYQFIASLRNDTTLVTAFTANEKSLFVSRDGGATWTVRNTTVTTPSLWWGCNTPDAPDRCSYNAAIPFGRSQVTESQLSPGTWILASGFGVLSSTDEGNTWAWASQGIGEVCMFTCHSHPTVANWTFCGAQDLTGFILYDVAAASAGDTGYIPMFNRERSYWEVDYAKGEPAWLDLTGTTSKGLRAAGTTQETNLGQFMTWSDPSDPTSYISWVNSTAIPGINVWSPFAELYQSPDNAQDLLIVAANLWMENDKGGQQAVDIPRPRAASRLAAARALMAAARGAALAVADGDAGVQRLREKLPKGLPGIARSTDGGLTWHSVGNNTNSPPSGFVGSQFTDFNQLASDAGDPNSRWWAIGCDSLYISKDRGETWLQPPMPPMYGWFVGQVVPDLTSAGGAGHAFALVQQGNGQALRYTADWSTTWTTIGNFSLPGDPGDPWPRIDVHPSGRVAILAYGPGDTMTNVYVSMDRGATWTCITSAAAGTNIGGGVTGLHWDRTDPRKLYIPTGGRSVYVASFLQ